MVRFLLQSFLLILLHHISLCKSEINPDGSPVYKNSEKKGLRMSRRAQAHLAEEENPGSYPKLQGVNFPGCLVHPLFEQPSDLMKMINSHGSDADNTTSQELAQGFDALHACAPEESYEIFDAIIQHFPETIFAYIGRGISLGRLANKIRASSENAMKDFDHAIKLRPHFYMTYRGRAEVHFLTGRYNDAMKDAEKDLHYKHDGSAYVMAGILSYKTGKDHQATQHLKMAHKYVSGHNAVSYEYLGISYLNLGMLRKAIESLKTSLEYEEENLRVLRTLGYLFSQLGDAPNAHYYLDGALKLKADDIESLEMKGHVFMTNGNPREALEAYKTCARQDPVAHGCIFSQGLAYATIGKFYDAVKACTMVMLVDFCTNDMQDPVYLRDFYRFLHSLLDRSLEEYRFDEELPDHYRNIWAGRPPHFNYSGLPGIMPHISDVDHEDFNELSANAKILACRALQLSPLLQYHTDGFMPNQRTNLAMGFAAIDVGQVLLKYWANPRKYRGWKGRHFSWRDLFDVAVKWRKLVSMDHPVLWMDQLPKATLDAGYVTHIVMQTGHTETPRYAPYVQEALQLAKFMIKSLLGPKLPTKAQDQVLKAVTPTDILTVLRKYESTNPQGGFTVGMQVPSCRPKGGLLHGVMLSISGNTEEDTKLSIQSARTSPQISQYHSELSYVFNQLKDEALKRKNSKDDRERIGNTIIKLIYYFYNSLSLSRGTSAVAYSTAMGAFLATGQEFESLIPAEKQPDIEAYFAGSSDAFIKRMRAWLTVKQSSVPVQDYPSVADTFPTSRSILEVLSSGVSAKLCENVKLVSAA